MALLSLQRIEGFQKGILSWFAKNRRELPWRDVPFDTSLKAAQILVQQYSSSEPFGHSERSEESQGKLRESRSLKRIVLDKPRSAGQARTI